ncbi:hypothetical protein H2198_004968 [Neophaeococcomyces mojaviensis]|uniref:Uncharacterized protein n=1 Tax=Neophaeococcomyces mojaviensis TaxID=3383035 RepID=A0ACC3A6Z2_9EURO|nr:hypothetical protein H2198_004968 [Knufia sp. JES_112]
MDNTYFDLGAPLATADGHETDDSGYSSRDDVSVLSRSVHSSIYDYRFEHGRRYHAFKQGETDYFMPNDEREQVRMDMQHRCMFLSTGQKLFHAPLESPIRALDLGTGTGIWALEMSEKYPQTQIVGVDLSPIQPEWAPENVRFEIDDVEDEWTWPENHFDLIHSKVMLLGSIRNHRRYFEQAFKQCAPNGFFEINEITTHIRSDHYNIVSENAILRWTTLLKQGIEQMGTTLDLDFDRLANLMREVGFVDVTVKPFKHPIGTWPADPVLKQAGSIQLVAMLEGLEGLSMAVFTRCLNWSVEDTKKLLEQTSYEFCRKRACYYWPGFVFPNLVTILRPG